MPKYARVVCDISAGRQFDYLIPPSLEGSVLPGSRVWVPFRSRRMSAWVMEVADTPARPGARDIISVRDSRPVLSDSMMKLAVWLSSYYSCPLHVALRCMVPSSVRKGRAAKMPLFVCLEREKATSADLIESMMKKAPVQARILKVLLKSEGPVPARHLLKEASAGHAALKSLERKGLIGLVRRRIYRDPWEGEEIVPEEHLPPTPEQMKALDHVRGALSRKEFSTVLLHGITGSGKTEVYLQSIDEAVRLGRGAIMLVPEISLTPQIVERFKARFGENVAVLHSRLSEGERLDEWERLRDGKARVVVGARSAVFAPVSGLGLIVVDEEHERTYKQEETPRYHARDVAVVRGKFEDAVVILGSATPALESYRNAITGKYCLFHLPRRIQDRPLPTVTVVDMRNEMRQTGRMTFFSRRLLKAMEERLEKGEQVILFLNRRGFSPVLICGRCGSVQKCPNCSVSLTAHGEGEKMICHLCGYSAKPPESCPRCRSRTIRFPGIGTQKLELMVTKLFPDLRVARMDTDSMASRDAHLDVYRAFKRGEIKILLGTQMIAKGLHIPNVTLVGVISADTALNLPDFRAAEHTFQLMTQVAGRAGRGDVPGEVIIQTYAPAHPAILAATSQDYESFYRQEIAFREELRYPPFARLVAITLKGRGSEALRWVSGRLARELIAAAAPGMEVVGPAPAPISRVREYYRWQIILKGDSVPAMSEVVKKAIARLKPGRAIQIMVDADPISLL